MLLNAAPHIIWPMEFVLPHDSHLRPYWLIQLGLKIYDFLGFGFKRGTAKLKSSTALDFSTDKMGDPLHNTYKRGFSYADCWVQDSRMVTLNAVDAYERGAVIMPRTACIGLEPSHDKDGWDVNLQNVTTGDTFQIKARQVVNAAGPWVRDLLDNSKLTEDTDKQMDTTPHVRLVKGSHIIIPRLYEGEQSYILQQPDNRIVFAIPYEHQYTLVGTTDKPFDGDAANVTIDDDEVDYLCAAINRSFKTQISADDVATSYSGVRSLLDDGNENASKVTRDYKLFLDKKYGPPILSVFGGKITTYRKLAEDVVNRLSTFYPDRKMKPWTEYVTLPGGDIPDADFEGYVAQQQETYDFMPPNVLRRYIRAYGTRFKAIIGSAQSLNALGTHYGNHVYSAEILYLLRYEFATTLEDIMWRRSKLGIHVSRETKQHLEVDFAKLISIVKNEDNNYAHFARN